MRLVLAPWDVLFLFLAKNCMPYPKSKVVYALAAVTGFGDSCLSQHGVLSNNFW